MKSIHENTLESLHIVTDEPWDDTDRWAPGTTPLSSTRRRPLSLHTPVPGPVSGPVSSPVSGPRPTSLSWTRAALVAGMSAAVVAGVILAHHARSVYTNEWHKAATQRDRDQDLLTRWCSLSDHHVKADHCTLAAARSRDAVDVLARRATWTELTQWLPPLDWCERRACFERTMMLADMFFWPLLLVCTAATLAVLAIAVQSYRGHSCGLLRGWCSRQTRRWQRRVRQRGEPRRQLVVRLRNDRPEDEPCKEVDEREPAAFEDDVLEQEEDDVAEDFEDEFEPDEAYAPAPLLRRGSSRSATRTAPFYHSPQ